MIKGRVYGYARVSSKNQHLDRQIEALKKYVPEENILTDKASGKDLDRPAYQALKSALGLRKGDILIITSLDRLSRNKNNIRQELQWFSDNKIRLKILDLPTTLVEVTDGHEWIVDMINNILIEVLSSMAEQERLLIRKRQRQGIDAAKAKGKHLGRPYLELPKNSEYIIELWKNKEIGTQEACNRLGISKTSLYRIVKRK